MNPLEKIFEPSVSHRFLATFFFKGIPSPLDLRFQRISGLSKGVLAVSTQHQGGVNVDNLFLPERVSHPPLILERGVMVPTPLMLAFEYVLSGFDTFYVDVVIMLLNHRSLPVCTWTVTDALPVKWQTGDLDADSNTPLINHIELVYRDIQWLGVKA
jgi:phage tail-like protein